MTTMTPSLDRQKNRDFTKPSSLNGVLNVNKPDGWTSHDVVQRVRSVLGIQKVGHAGTLDPHATGVLPLLIGKGTKIAEYLLGWDKEYAAVLRLGQRTDTQDAWGAVLNDVSTENLREEDIRSTIAGFQGSISQVPPMFSAVKMGGQPLYKKARKGETVHRTAKTVVIHELEIQKLEIPEVSFRVVCSKGTYVRTLCEDIGDRLQVGGHLTWLQRRRVGIFHIDQAMGLHELQDGLEISELNGAFLSIDQVLDRLSVVEVDGDDVRKVSHGNAIPWDRVGKIHQDAVSPEGENRVRVKNKNGDLLALGYGPRTVRPEIGPVLSIETVLV